MLYDVVSSQSGEKRVKTTIHVKRVSSKKEMVQAYDIRMRVFVQEQGVPAEIELDRDDKRAIHFLVLVSGKPAGTARLVKNRGAVKIGRMAVLKPFRRKGVGTTLLRQAIATAKKLHAKKIYLHAQVAVTGFYEKQNFRCVGPIFDEAGIRHRKMVLKKSQQQKRKVAKGKVMGKRMSDSSVLAALSLASGSDSALRCGILRF